MLTHPRKAGRARIHAAAALLVALGALFGTAQPSAADPRPSGAAEGTLITDYYDNPLSRPTFDLRIAVSGQRGSTEAFDPWRNAASVLVDPRLLSEEEISRLLDLDIDDARGGVAVQATKVNLYDVRRYINRDDFVELSDNEEKLPGYKEGSPSVIAISALNVRGVHSEKVIEDLLRRHGLRQLAGYSERQQCSRCSPFYDSDIKTFYSVPYDLNPGEVQKRKERLAAAKSKKERASIEAEYEEVRKERSKTAARKLEEIHLHARDAQRRAGLKASSATNTVLRPPAAGGCGKGTKAQGLDFPRLLPRTIVHAVVFAAGVSCGERKSSTGIASALSSPGAVPGGIDFSSLQLRYLADAGDGSGLRYSFSARQDAWNGDPRTATGLAAARQASDAFFVWLELKPSTFWVNLNPNEPDRVVDAQLGRTDVGRILLQADLQMKKTAGQLIHPDTPLGKQFLSGLAGDCISFRAWIVPAPATVREDGDKLYILDAPLDVKTEAQYLLPSDSRAAVSCPRLDATANQQNEQRFRTLVLPRLRKEINTGPAYAELRRVYLARVAAEWYRSLSKRKHTAYRGLVDQGNVDAWTTKTGWVPADTFRKFVDSYTKGEYKTVQRTTVGSVTYTRTYVYGGVDLSTVPFAPISGAEMDARHPRLLQAVQRSVDHTENSPDGSVWLGGVNASPGRGMWTRLGDRVGGLAHGTTGILVVVVTALGAITFGFRGGTRRQRPPTA